MTREYPYRTVSHRTVKAQSSKTPSPNTPSPNAPSSSSPEVAACPLPRKPYVVLIVDDAVADREIYRRYIKAEATTRMTFVEAEDGEYGLALCQQLRPDLILLDYRLPDIDGLEFLQLLNEQVSYMPPTIMLTGEGNEQAAVMAMKLGARDYLVKGEVNSASLNQAIRRVVSQQALRTLTTRQEREQKLLIAISRRIAYAHSATAIMSEIAEGARQILACDRLLIYQFNSDLSGAVVAESVLPKWTSHLLERVDDTCFKTEGIDRYRQGYVGIINDTATANLSECHLKMLERHEVKANLAVPILVCNPTPHKLTQKELDRDNLATASEETRTERFRTEGGNTEVWGLMIAHSCQTPRTWQKDEQAFLDSLAVQLAIAVRQDRINLQLQEKNS